MNNSDQRGPSSQAIIFRVNQFDLQTMQLPTAWTFPVYLLVEMQKFKEHQKENVGFFHMKTEHVATVFLPDKCADSVDWYVHRSLSSGG